MLRHHRVFVCSIWGILARIVVKIKDHCQPFLRVLRTVFVGGHRPFRGINLCPEKGVVIIESMWCVRFGRICGCGYRPSRGFIHNRPRWIIGTTHNHRLSFQILHDTGTVFIRKTRFFFFFLILNITVVVVTTRTKDI